MDTGKELAAGGVALAQRPTVGRVVVYVLPADALHRYPTGREHAAIITGVVDENTVDLHVLFNRQRPENRDAVKLCTTMTSDSEQWHWPLGGQQGAPVGALLPTAPPAMLDIARSLRLDYEDAKAEIVEKVSEFKDGIMSLVRDGLGEHHERLTVIEETLSRSEPEQPKGEEQHLTLVATGTGDGAETGPVHVGIDGGPTGSIVDVAVTDEELKTQQDDAAKKPAPDAE